MAQILSFEEGDMLNQKRLSSKLQFLQKENNHLKDYVKDLEKTIKINKSAIDILVAESNNETNLEESRLIAKRLLTETSDKTPELFKGESALHFLSENDPDHSPSPTSKFRIPKNAQVPFASSKEKRKLLKTSHEVIMRSILNENKILSEQLKKAQKERNEAHSKSLLQEQITNNVLAAESELISNYEAKLLELTKNIRDKEVRIQKLEVSKPLVELENVVVVHRNVISIREEARLLNDEIKLLQNLLSESRKSQKELKSQNEHLRLMLQVTSPQTYC